MKNIEAYEIVDVNIVGIIFPEQCKFDGEAYSKVLEGIKRDHCHEGGLALFVVYDKLQNICCNYKEGALISTLFPQTVEVGFGESTQQILATIPSEDWLTVKLNELEGYCGTEKITLQRGRAGIDLHPKKEDETALLANYLLPHEICADILSGKKQIFAIDSREVN